MKQRIAGKIIKHPTRYNDDMYQRAYERLVRSLRRYYKRMSKTEDTWMRAFYTHKSAEPFFMLCCDVDEIWNVNNKDIL